MTSALLRPAALAAFTLAGLSLTAPPGSGRPSPPATCAPAFTRAGKVYESVRPAPEPEAMLEEELEELPVAS